MKIETPSPGAPKRRSRRGDSRSQLLDAASKILSERNVIDVSLSEIAEVSGLNSALIKYHFGNKEGLLLALVQRDAEKSLAHLERLLAMDISPEEKIRLHITGIINTYSRHPYLNRLMHTLINNPDKTVASRIANFFVRPLVEAQGKILQEGQDLGVFREVDRMCFYYQVVGACDILFYARHSLDVVFGITELTPAIRADYSNRLVEGALTMLRNTPESPK